MLSMETLAPAAAELVATEKFTVAASANTRLAPATRAKDAPPTEILPTPVTAAVRVMDTSYHFPMVRIAFEMFDSAARLFVTVATPELTVKVGLPPAVHPVVPSLKSPFVANSTPLASPSFASSSRPHVWPGPVTGSVPAGSCQSCTLLRSISRTAMLSMDSGTVLLKMRLFELPVAEATSVSTYLPAEVLRVIADRWKPPLLLCTPTPIPDV